MNIYVKKFLHRGLLFAGGGPLVAAIVYLCLELAHVDVNLNGYQVALAIVTSLIIAFVHAGSSVFPQIESWSRVKGIFFQGFSVWAVYMTGYLINRWLPFNPLAIILATVGFIVAFLITWLIVFITVRIVTKKMNEKLINQLNKEGGKNE